MVQRGLCGVRSGKLYCYPQGEVNIDVRRSFFFLVDGLVFEREGVAFVGDCEGVLPRLGTGRGCVFVWVDVLGALVGRTPPIQGSGFSEGISRFFSSGERVLVWRTGAW